MSATLIIKALDGLSTRYAFVAQNIANANSAAYRPVRVSFEERLRAAAPNGPEAVRNVKVETHLEAESQAPPEMRLDLELGEASWTAMRYRALLEVLSRQMALHRAVVSQGGK